MFSTFRLLYSSESPAREGFLQKRTQRPRGVWLLARSHVVSKGQRWDSNILAVGPGWEGSRERKQDSQVAAGLAVPGGFLSTYLQTVGERQVPGNVRTPWYSCAWTHSALGLFLPLETEKSLKKIVIERIILTLFDTKYLVQCLVFSRPSLDFKG